jgi:hypothetical protein
MRIGEPWQQSALVWAGIQDEDIGLYDHGPVPIICKLSRYRSGGSPAIVSGSVCGHLSTINSNGSVFIVSYHRDRRGRLLKMFHRPSGPTALGSVYLSKKPE